MPRRARCIGPAVAAILVVAGCAVPGDQPSGSGDAASAFDPVAVPGVEDCTTLSVVPDPDPGSRADRLPGLDLPCLTESSRVDTAALGGKPTLINLWATWCGPCREEMPILQAAYERTAGAVQFVGVDTKDDPTAAAEFVREVGVTYPQLVDGEGELLGHTGVRGLPVTLVLDDEGEEAARHIGPLNEGQLEELLAQVEGD